MDDKLKFGSRVEAFEDRLHMTDEDLAKRLGITRRTLQNYKRDPAPMPYATLEKMCRIFNCPVELLTEGRDTKAEYTMVLRLIREALRGGEE